MKKIFLFLLITLSISAFSQAPSYKGRTSHWYFGIECGLDFTNMVERTSTATTGSRKLWVPASEYGPVYTLEGCFSISDIVGNFLMASDGTYVYDRVTTKWNNTPLTNTARNMQNGFGLMGNPSATNSGILVPMPDSPDKYYIFTTAVAGVLTTGYRWNVVDMAGNGSLGAVTTKNQQLSMTNATGTLGYGIANAYENIGAVGHTNGIDYWLIARVRAYFLVWKITSSGISAPVFYAAGEDLGYPGDAANNCIGTIRISPSGTRLVHCGFNGGRITIANFNPTTGAISAVKRITPNFSRAYGAEFSPDETKLYLTCIQSSTPAQNGLYVWDVTNWNSIPTTQTISLLLRYANTGNVQLGPDNRIYAIGTANHAGQNRTSLFVIPNPNAGWVGATTMADFPNYWPGKSILSPTADRYTHLGLPTFITTYFTPGDLEFKVPLCTGNSNLFKMDVIGDIGKMVWDFGDGTPAQTDNSASHNGVYHTYQTAGTYTITIDFYSNSTGMVVRRVTSTVRIMDCVIQTNHTIRTIFKP